MMGFEKFTKCFENECWNLLTKEIMYMRYTLCRGESGIVVGCEMFFSVSASNIRLVRKLDLQPLHTEYPPSSPKSTSKSDKG